MADINETVRLAELGANQLSCCPPNMLVSESQRAIRALIAKASETCERYSMEEISAYFIPYTETTRTEIQNKFRAATIERRKLVETKHEEEKE